MKPSTKYIAYRRVNYMDIEALGTMIKKRRQFLRIDQISFCELADISQHTLSRIENGKGNPSLSTLQKLLTILGLELRIGVKGVA